MARELYIHHREHSLGLEVAVRTRNLRTVTHTPSPDRCPSLLNS